MAEIEKSAAAKDREANPDSPYWRTKEFSQYRWHCAQCGGFGAVEITTHDPLIEIAWTAAKDHEDRFPGCNGPALDAMSHANFCLFPPALLYVPVGSDPREFMKRL